MSASERETELWNDKMVLDVPGAGGMNQNA
jgi:hypothetical protein